MATQPSIIDWQSIFNPVRQQAGALQLPPPVVQQQPQPQANAGLDFVKAITPLVKRDVLGETARRNAQGTHTTSEWAELFPNRGVQSNPFTQQQRVSALQNLQGQSGAEHLNIGGGQVVGQETPQFNTTGLNSITTPTPGGEIFAYPGANGEGLQEGTITGSVSYPNQPQMTVEQLMQMFGPKQM